MIRQGHLIAVVGAFLIGCAVLLLVAGCAGVRSQARKEEQGHTEATASEEARCSQTRTYKEKWEPTVTTNDVPGCPNGGLLSGTDGRDNLDGKYGNDEIHGLRDNDYIYGGMGSDVIYGGPGKDAVSGTYPGPHSDRQEDRSHNVLHGGPDKDSIGGGLGDDVMYGGDGNDLLVAASYKHDDGVDKLYCGPGKDHYVADKLDYVDSSCEKKEKPPRGGGGIA